jgi:hypothetical protein
MTTNCVQLLMWSCTVQYSVLYSTVYCTVHCTVVSSAGGLRHLKPRLIMQGLAYIET